MKNFTEYYGGEIHNRMGTVVVKVMADNLRSEDYIKVMSVVMDALNKEWPSK